MYRLFSGNLIGCVGYSITRVSLIYHLVGDWQPDAAFCMSVGGGASFPPTCSSQVCLASRRAFVRENSSNPATKPRRMLLFIAVVCLIQLWRGGCAGLFTFQPRIRTVLIWNSPLIDCGSDATGYAGVVGRDCCCSLDLECLRSICFPTVAVLEMESVYIYSADAEDRLSAARIDTPVVSPLGLRRHNGSAFLQLLSASACARLLFCYLLTQQCF